MSRRPRPVFEWPLDGQPLTFEVVVLGRSCCRAYTAPPGRGGFRLSQRWHRGMRFDAVGDASDHPDYVTVLTTEGSYINVWAKYNRRGEPVGVVFAVPVAREALPQAQGGIAPRPSRGPPARSRSRSDPPRAAPAG